MTVHLRTWQDGRQGYTQKRRAIFEFYGALPKYDAFRSKEERGETLAQVIASAQRLLEESEDEKALRCR